MQSLLNIIGVGTSGLLRGAGHVARVGINAYNFVVKTEGNSPFGRHTYRWTIILERM